MRWLLLKDLQILRRSPLVTTLLVLYPVAIAVLLGLALSRAPEKPRVAFLNEVPESQQLNVGGSGGFDKASAREQLCSRVDCVDVSSREQAEQMVADGDVLAALILPPGLIDQLESLTSLNPEQPTVEVLVNEDDPIKAQLVEDRIHSLITEANLLLSKKVSGQAANYLDLLVRGGTFDLLGQSLEILGLKQSGEILKEIRAETPKKDRAELDRVIRFATLARENLDLALPLLGAISEPIHVDTTVVNGGASSLDSFGIAVAATMTLMFVTVLLVAGSLALEREENAFPRLTRGLIGRSALLAEKLGLGIAVSLVVTLLMLAGLELFLDLDWGRFLLWLVAIVAGGAAFAAFGAAIGGAAREVRASSLIAFMVSLPIAFLSLVSTGTVSPALFHVIEVVRALFPFDPALDAMSGALDSAGPAIGLPVLHLAILALAYGALARLALRRFR